MKRKLTHAEQALSKIMGDVVRLPRRSAPKEPDVNPAGIRVQYVDARADSLLAGVLDTDEVPPTLYVNRNCEHLDMATMAERLRACCIVVRLGCKPWTTKCVPCPYCGFTMTDAETLCARRGMTTANAAMCYHLGMCWARFLVDVKPYSGEHSFGVAG